MSHIPKSRQRRVLSAIAVGSILISLTACSSDSKSASDTTAAGAGGGDRTGQTIKVGYVNNEGGVFSLPEFRIGGEVAINAINKAGGVNGAQIEVVSCLADASPEGSINCANKLIEAGVVLAYTGIDVASDAAVSLYAKAKIPYITSNGWGPAQEKDPNAFIMHAAGGAYFSTPLLAFKKQGIKKVAVVFEDTAAGRAYQPMIGGFAKTLGLEIITTIIDPVKPDWTGALATSKSQGAEAIWGQLQEPGCIGLVTAADAVKFDGIVFAGSCSVYMSVTGDKAIGSYNQSDLYFPNTRAVAPAKIQTRIDEYRAAMTAAGQEKLIDGFAPAPYSTWYELRSVLQSIDAATPITSESVLAALNSGATIPGWMGPDLHCGAKPWPDAPSACSSMIAVWKVVKLADGTLGREQVADFIDAYAAISK